MREFLKSLSKTQQQLFVDLVEDNSRSLPALSYAVKENLLGNPEPYNQITGGPGKKLNQDQDDDVADPAIKAYLERRRVHDARLNDLNTKRINNQ